MDTDKLNSEYENLKETLNFYKIEKVAKTSRLLSILFIPLLFILFVYGGYKINNLRHEISILEIQERHAIGKSKKIQEEIVELQKEKAIAEADLIKALGYSPAFIEKELNDDAQSTAIAANTAIKDITKSSWNNKKGIEVYYYNKTIDEKKIVVGLESLGYKFIAATPGKYMNKKQTNAIWFGSDVPLDDIKVVALALIRAGIQIKAVRPYRNSKEKPDYKSNRIEVGASIDIERSNPLTIDEIVNAKEFTR
ncbi:hypothetical protein A5320_17830 [Rheinheimera sp. SA_1]|uniref:hypothetical protein n=1 Tax=Rheinheimera sp. SA_1 TaxID=1827365 RepID=UPI0007FDC3CF|nr:hypothetical protein [Rheinheimera sp. SA_1]OBP13773.1 hypothetical protein A5320_17830 [Rheinheimera sp. SA_1]